MGDVVISSDVLSSRFTVAQKNGGNCSQCLKLYSIGSAKQVCYSSSTYMSSTTSNNGTLTEITFSCRVQNHRAYPNKARRRFGRNVPHRVAQGRVFKASCIACSPKTRAESEMYLLI